MDEDDLKVNIINNLSIEISTKDSSGSFDMDGHWKCSKIITVELLYEGQVISSSDVFLD